MTKNLLALLLALQKVTISDETQQYLLPQLGNKLDVVKKAWQNVHASIEAILQQESELKEHYQQIKSELAQMTDEELLSRLSDVEIPVAEEVVTLGYKPGLLPSLPRQEKKDELGNIVLDISQIISRQANSEESKALLRNLSQLTDKKPKE